jgi:hypothetical protein
MYQHVEAKHVPTSGKEFFLKILVNALTQFWDLK